MKTNFEKKINGLIPSKTIKEYLRKHNDFHFSSMDNLCIMYLYSENWYKYMEYLSEASKVNNDKEIKSFIKKNVDFESKQWELLTRNDEGFIYKVKVNNDTESFEESYFADSYEMCIVIIRDYLRTYKEYSSEIVSFDIDKVRLGTLNTRYKVDKNTWIAGTILDKKLNPIKIYTDLKKPLYKEVSLDDYVIDYPKIFKKYDLVSYVNPNKVSYIEDGTTCWKYASNSKIEYGINSFDNDDKEIACVLSINSPYVKKRTISVLDEKGYCPYLMAHDHIDFGKIELVDLCTITNDIKEDYLYIKEELIKLNY